MAEKIVGYFVWALYNGIPFPEKLDKETHDGKQPDTRKLYDGRVVEHSTKYLTEDEWKLSLTELAKRYPCPPIHSSPNFRSSPKQTG